MGYYRIAIVGRFEFLPSCIPWNTYQDLKLAGHVVEMIDTQRFSGRLFAGGQLNLKFLSRFIEVFRPDLIAWHDETAEEVLAQLADVPAHEGPTPRRFVVAGYVGEDNFGDEFIFKTICERLRRDYPGCLVSLVGYGPRRTLARHGVVAVGRWEKAAMSALLNGASALIFMAGIVFDTPFRKRGAGLADMFMDTGMQIPGHTALTELAYLNDVPTVFLGIGGGPLELPDAQRLVRLGSLTRPRYVARDEQTAQLLLACGVDPALVVQKADLAFCADYPALGADARTLLAENGCEPGGYFVVSLRDHDTFSEGMLDAVAGAADALYDQRGLKAVFLSFNPKDEAQHRLVQQRMACAQAAVLLGTADFDITTQVIGAASFVLAMRLHCTIIAAAQGIPGVGLDYNVKVSEAYRQLGLGEFLLPMSADAESVAGACLGLLDRREEVRERVAAAAQRNRRLANEAFAELDAMLPACPSPTRQFPYTRYQSDDAVKLKQAQADLAHTKDQLKSAQSELEDARAQLGRARADLEKIRSSRTWRLRTRLRRLLGKK